MPIHALYLMLCIWSINPKLVACKRIIHCVYTHNQTDYSGGSWLLILLGLDSINKNVALWILSSPIKADNTKLSVLRLMQSDYRRVITWLGQIQYSRLVLHRAQKRSYHKRSGQKIESMEKLLKQAQKKLAKQNMVTGWTLFSNVEILSPHNSLFPIII